LPQLFKLAQLKKPFSAIMKFSPNMITEKRLMARAARSLKIAVESVEPQSFVDCLRYFLTPAVWKQVLPVFRPYHAQRWRPQPLLLTLLVMTWCAGESQAERFETAKAFYVACHQRQRRPGKTLVGFQKALARVPTCVFRAAATAIRVRFQQVFAPLLAIDGFVPMGCDGSRLDCPRTPELQKYLLTKSKRRRPAKPKKESPKSKEPGQPSVFVTAFVHLATGLLWSWRLGGARASERDHLVHLLPTLQASALVVADAGYVGYELMDALNQRKRHFLIRLCANAPLWTTQRVAVRRFREGIALYWPQNIQAQQGPPIRVRVLRIHKARKIDVWLMTNVLDSQRLPLATASKFYRWRWRNEGLFRTYKRTFGKVKLLARTVAQVHREAESSLLAVQLVLAQGVLALHQAPQAGNELSSPRKILLEVRREINEVTGSYLSQRRRRCSFLERLKQAWWKPRPRRKKNQVRQHWPKRPDHKPPKPPRFLRMGTDLKDLADKTLGIPDDAAS
jgi:hypothetical protein